jgi:hypothetical protein
MYINSKLDRTAPRFRPTSLGLMNASVFLEFKNKYPQYKNIPDEKLKEIVYEFNGQMWEAAIDCRDGVELPEGLGNVFIGSCKTPVKINRDHQTSEKLGTTVQNRNLATDGYLAKIFYTNHKTKYRFRNRNLWVFKGDRKFTNTVSSVYKEEWPKYIVVEDYRKISSFFTNLRKKEYIKKLIDTNKVDASYNEFDLD